MRVLRFLLIGGVLLAAGCVPVRDITDGGKPAEPKFNLRPASFEALDGWSSASLEAAFEAFRTSCAVVKNRAPADAMGGNPAYGLVADWQPSCEAALNTRSGTDSASARAFFMQWFSPVQVFNGEEPKGLFTGYYEPELEGHRVRTSVYNVPLYRRPSDLIEVDLGRFRASLKGERIAGKIMNGRLVPYQSRQEIVSSGLGSASKPLVYVNDSAAAFFLQIQGSGRIKLKTGEIIRAAYDGQNGHPYTAIGRILVDRGEVPKSELSMQRIRQWMVENPTKADALMNENASYVFFKELPIGDPAKGADGAQGVPLTPSASLAIDLKFHALGAPLWVDARAPSEDESAEDVEFSHLFIAQDTGGAIRGPIRGDVYWGAGSRAESIAGRMAHKGQMFILLPRSLAAKID